MIIFMVAEKLRLRLAVFHCSMIYVSIIFFVMLEANSLESVSFFCDKENISNVLQLIVPWKFVRY